MHTTSEKCIPMNVAAEAAEMTRAELIAALGPDRVIIVNSNKLAVRPEHLEAVAPGASAGLAVYHSESNRADSWPW